MNENELPPDDDPDMLIAEYVLGVLTREERDRVQAMAALNPHYQSTIAAWQHHFAEWIAQVPESNPPADSWCAIEQQLFPSETSPQPRSTGWWNNLRFWRWTATALAAGLLVTVFILQPPVPNTRPAMLARLEQSNGYTLFTATINLDGRSVLFVRTRSADWENKSAQAWVISTDGKPHSLGLLPANAAVTLSVPSELAATLGDGAVLAVSLEPLNGSPTGLPTGPVIAKGKISSL
ncbi:anti-sigma factor [Pseudomonas sp. N40(2020)]|uniref:anti-sigma factor n=1 Tax=Pseudomonas sp. N40(2020) TaxID=2767798 RepID=UPI001656B1CE|nr:anti-sigma factor [Pseudomonas sp. N40(2020)]MBC8996333.1 anti-sigma factor [Pseudomonas sp. N40(2020)]